MDAVRIHMWEFIKSSFNRQVHKDRQRVKTKVAVQSSTCTWVIGKAHVSRQAIGPNTNISPIRQPKQRV